MEVGLIHVSVPDVDNLIASGTPLPSGWEHDRDREVKKKKSRLLISKCLVIQKAQFGFFANKITKAATIKEAVLYVHGYNNKFSLAAMKFALAAYKMKADAPLFMFSWPSFQVGANPQTQYLEFCILFIRESFKLLRNQAVQ